MVRSERLRWLILGLLFLSTVINYVDRQALSVLMPALREGLALSSADYGLITTIFLVAYTVALVPMGLLIDRIGTRLGFAIAIVGWSLAALAHAVAQGALSLGICRALLGATEAGNWPAGTKAVASWFPPERRAFAMAVFDSGSAVGAVLAPPLVAFIAHQWGWRMAFLLTGALGLVWLIGWLTVYHAPDRHPWLTSGKPVDPVPQPSRPMSQAGFIAPLRGLIRVRALWGLMATRFVATPVWWFYVFWLPDYLHQGRGFSLVEIGLYGWMPYMAVDLGKMAGGALSDRLLARGHSANVARRSLMIAGAALMLGGLCVNGAGSTAAAIAWICIATAGFGMWSANILALHADIFPAATMATAMSATTMAASLGGAVATFAIGRLVDDGGYGPVFLVMGCLPLVALALLFLLVGPLKRIDDPENDP